MTQEEADILVAIIREAFPHCKIEIKERGGNQRVVYMKGNQRFIWSKEDWFEHFAPKEENEEEEAIAS